MPATKRINKKAKNIKVRVKRAPSNKNNFKKEAQVKENSAAKQPLPAINEKTFSSGKSGGRSKKISLYRKIAVSFIVLTVLLLTVIFYFSFASLKIILIPSQEKISDNLTINVYDKDAAAKPSTAKNAVAGIVEQVEIEAKENYAASGEEVIGEDLSGTVAIVNNYTKNQPLVASTRIVSSDNKMFRIKETVNVPAGGKTEVAIYADNPGPEMAIGPTKFTIPGLWAGLQDKIYAENANKFTYGQQVKKYIVQSDIDQGVKSIKNSLIEKAKKDIGSAYKGYSITLYSLDENTVSTEVDGKVGEEKDKFSISMKTKVTVVAFSDTQIVDLAKKKLLSIIPDNKELVEFEKDKTTYVLNSFDIKAGVSEVGVSFESKMTLKDDANIIDRNKIVSLTREQLEEYLSSFNEIAGFEIDFSPSFIQKVPNLVDRINIEIKK